LNFVDAWSIDEIVILDITRSGYGDRANFYNIVSNFARNCFVPLAVGGGVRDINDFNILLKVGADKIVLNTGAVERPELINEAARLFGSQCVVLSIDAKRSDRLGYEVYTNFGTKPTGMHPSEWAQRAFRLGAGEIMITSIEKDGTLEGYDNNLTRIVSDAVNIPVLACGGAGNWSNFLDGFVKGGASAVCTTNIYHFTETSIRSAKKFLNRSGILVRI
jgi:cyclase